MDEGRNGTNHARSSIPGDAQVEYPQGWRQNHSCWNTIHRVGLPMKKPPCKGCERRRPKCHCECEAYRSWKKEHDAAMNRRRTESMLDGHSDWCSYDRLYWDRSINQERQREIWRAKKREEAKRERRRQEKRDDKLRATCEESGRATSEGGDGTSGGGKRAGA